MTPTQPAGLASPTSQPQPTSAELPSATVAAPSAPTQTALSPTEQITPPPGGSIDPFWGLHTATPGSIPPDLWLTPAPGAVLQPFAYWTQPGDTLSALSARFGVSADQIKPAQPAVGLLQPGQMLTIPNLLGAFSISSAWLPDSAVVYSPMAAGFNINDYITQAGGYLSTYREEVNRGEWLTGAEIIQQMALNNSVNPQLLLALLEFRSGWVRSQPAHPDQVEHPIGINAPGYEGLYLELSLVAEQLNRAYYGWRQGSPLDVKFSGNPPTRIDPGLNAGSAALQMMTSIFYEQQQDWLNALYGSNGFLYLYTQMFGDAWQSAAQVEPLFPSGLMQPTLELPFAPGEHWSLTAGPNFSWDTNTPLGALRFSPISKASCADQTARVTASASGVVVRTWRDMLVLDLDGDGNEQTGWVLVYRDIAERDRVAPGTQVNTDDFLGHPYCEEVEGGTLGIYTSLARKYNGEWLAADGPLPMVLSGWVAHAGAHPFDGTLEKDGQVVTARPDGSSGSTITR